MNLEQAIKDGHRFVVEVRRGMSRIAAEVYVVRTGLAFLDLGWAEPLSRPRAHYMPGPILGDGPWHVGDWAVRFFNDDDPEEHDEWERWQRNRQEAEAYGIATDRQAGAEYATRVLGIEVEP